MSYCRVRFIPLLLACLTLLLLLPLAVTAQDNTASMRVLVLSGEDGNPVASANVLLFEPGPDGKQLEGGVADTDGLLDFNDLAAGNYRLEVRFVGHQTYTETVELEQDRREIVRVVLEIDLELLGGLVVEAKRDITTGEVGVTRISSIDIARLPSPGAGGDLASYLQTVSGVVTAGDRGGDLYIRGGTPSQNRVYVDNMPIVKPFHISNLFSSFPEEAIQSVDLYAGGFGAEYLGASSAVLDINLKPGNLRRATGTAALSTQMASFHGEGPLEVDRQSLMIMGRHSLMEQTAPHLVGREEPIRFYDMIGRYSYQGDNITCNVTGLMSHDRGEISPFREERIIWSNAAVGARCLAFDEQFRDPMELTAALTDFRNREGPPEQTERTAGVRQGYFKLDLRTEAFEVPVDYGFGVAFNHYNAELSERFSSIESFHNNQAAIQSYVAGEWKVNSRMTLEPSIGSQLTIRTSPTFEPRLRFAWQPGGEGDREISFAVGKYSQLDHGIRDERDAGTVFTIIRPISQDQDLQTALHALLGYRQQLNRFWLINAEGFYKSHRNIQVSKWTPAASPTIETAMADGLTYGFDARVIFDREPAYLYLGYGWADNTYEAVTGDLGAWLDSPIYRYAPGHDQRHKINAVASYEWMEFTTSVSWEFGSGRPYTPIYGFDLRLNLPRQYPTEDAGTARTIYSRPWSERLPSYHRLDLSVKRTLVLNGSTDLTAEAGAINLYNRANIFHFDANALRRVNQTPFMPYLSLKAHFN